MINTYSLKKLNKKYFKSYKEFIEQSNESMFYYKLEYLNLISSLEKEKTIDNHLLLFKEEKIIAAMPIFIFKGEYGNVINSSPFFGSHGGIIKLPNVDSNLELIILNEFDNLYKKYNCISSTIIEKTNFNSPNSIERVNYKYNFIDKRISLFNLLPNEKNKEKIGEELIKNLHRHHRRIIIKYLKINDQFTLVRNETRMEELWEIHKSNMLKIGGKFKSLSFFKSIENFFKIGIDYEIYTLKKDQDIAATLLVFIHKDNVEYFTPAINDVFRDLQPLNCLIYETMIDLVYRRKSKIWNWGGTWEDQKGLYTYKKRWGAKETQYRYNHKCFSKDIS